MTDSSSSSWHSSVKPSFVLPHKTPNVRDLYEIGKKLGQGQFGTTYLCTDKSDNAEYACKSIPKRKLICREDYEDVWREIQIMHHLSEHPIEYGEFLAATLHMNKLEREENLVSAFSFFDKDGSGFITIDELAQACRQFGLDDVHTLEVSSINDSRLLTCQILIKCCWDMSTTLPAFIGY